MREKRLVVAAVAGLTVVAVAAKLVRARTWRQTNLGRGESSWRLTYDIRLDSVTSGSRLRVRIPRQGYRCRVIRQVFSHPSLAMDIVTAPTSATPEAVAVAPVSMGEARFRAEFDVLVTRRPVADVMGKPRKLSTADRSRYL